MLIGLKWEIVLREFAVMLLKSVRCGYKVPGFMQFNKNDTNTKIPAGFISIFLSLLHFN